MSVSVGSSPETPPVAPLWRWSIVAGVLAGEYACLSLLFDAAAIKTQAGLGRWLGEAGALAPLLVVAATAAALLWQWRGEGAWDATEKRRVSKLGVALHVAAYSAFVYTSHGLFEVGAGSGWLALAWGLLGAATAGTLLVTVFGVGVLTSSALRTMAGSALGLGAVAYLAGRLSSALWEPLVRPTFAVTHALLSHFEHFSSRPADKVLYLEDFGVTVAPECSGYEGIGLSFVLLGAFLFALRRELRFPRALLIVPVGVGLVWLGNSARLALLMVVGARISPELAYGAFHSKVGWIFFCTITLGVAWGARRSKFLLKDEPAESSTGKENLVAPFVLPLVALMAASLVTGAFSEALDPWFGLRVVAAGVVLYVFRERYRELWARPSWVSGAVGVAVAVAWLMTAGPAQSAQEPIQVALGNVPYWVVPVWVFVRALGSVAIAPIVEELAFRGYLYRWLVRRRFDTVSFRHVSGVALVVSSLAFGMLHGRWIAATVAGIAYAGVMLHRGKLVDAVTAHATSNAIIVAHLLVTGDWSDWA